MRFGSFEPLLGQMDLERVGNLASIRTAFPGVVSEIERHMRPEPISVFQVSAIGTPHPGQGIAFYQTPNHLGGFSVGSQRWPHLDWIIVGGESGRRARPMHPDWARSLRDQAQAAGVPFLFKQWGEWGPISEMSDADSDGLYWPEPDDTPDASRRCRVDSLCLDADGTRHDTGSANDYHKCPSGAFAGPKPMSMFRVGKRSSGRLLDGHTWDEMPEVAHG